jgi:methylated-DNA-[protein]-cysteine S-methyltransferase
MIEIHTTIDSPVGELLLGGDGESLACLSFVRGRRPAVPAATSRRCDDAYAGVRAQLDEYFTGERREFDVPLALRGSDFELRVWAALLQIPYGETRSYGEIAHLLGATGQAARAVGLANGRNPVALIVPCHRVIGADGSLTGYGGGLDRKRFLLDLESGILPLSTSSVAIASANSSA